MKSGLNALIVGASGYTGAELAAYLKRHTYIKNLTLAVSEKSVDAGKLLSDLHPQFKRIVDLPLQPLTNVQEIATNIDMVFLATAHEVSHDLAQQFLDLGCVVFDLSGAFRVNSQTFYSQYYGFTHQYPELLAKAVYGLAEWNDKSIKQAQLIAVPGCYPTASQLALKPLIKDKLLDSNQWPVINAVSGVSGAGRKASLTTSFCEVSLQPYGVFTHRHQPEISEHLGIPVIFTPHLGNFSRGILATITCLLKPDVDKNDVEQAFSTAYDNKPLVRVYPEGLSALKSLPSLKSIIGTPFCDIGFAIQGRHLIVVAAEDNLLKGAAAQAVQCLNLRFGFNETESLF